MFSTLNLGENISTFENSYRNVYNLFNCPKFIGCKLNFSCNQDAIKTSYLFLSSSIFDSVIYPREEVQIEQSGLTFNIFRKKEGWFRKWVNDCLNSVDLITTNLNDPEIAIYIPSGIFNMMDYETVLSEENKIQLSVKSVTKVPDKPFDEIVIQLPGNQRDQLLKRKMLVHFHGKQYEAVDIVPDLNFCPFDFSPFTKDYPHRCSHVVSLCSNCCKAKNHQHSVESRCDNWSKCWACSWWAKKNKNLTIGINHAASSSSCWILKQILNQDEARLKEERKEIYLKTNSPMVPANRVPFKKIQK